MSTTLPRTDTTWPRFVMRPTSSLDLGHIFGVLVDVVLVLDELVLRYLFLEQRVEYDRRTTGVFKPFDESRCAPSGEAPAIKGCAS
jgi:hypothetical protein